MSNLLDVAQHAGVSLGTASAVINGRTAGIRPDRLARVQEAIRVLDYQPNRAARFLKTGETPLIGMLVPSISYPSWSWLAREVEKVAKENYGYGVLVGNTDREPEKEIAFLKNMLSHGIRGAIIVSPLMQQEILDGWIAENVVAVSYDRRSPREEVHKIDYVTMSHAKAMSIAVSHLVENGHQHLAFVTVSGKSSSRAEKVRGFLQATKKAGLSGSAEIIECTARAAYGDDEMPELGREAALQLAARDKAPTGVIALNDMLAIGLMLGLQDQGFVIPDDVSIIGIDGLLISGYVSPALTTVRPPVPKMAKTMVDHLIHRLKDPEAKSIERIFVPELVVRKSVARIK